MDTHHYVHCCETFVSAYAHGCANLCSLIFTDAHGCAHNCTRYFGIFFFSFHALNTVHLRNQQEMYAIYYCVTTLTVVLRGNQLCIQVDNGGYFYYVFFFFLLVGYLISKHCTK